MKEKEYYFDLVSYLKPFYKKIFLIMLLAIFTAGLSAINPLLIEKIIDEGLLIQNLSVVVKTVFIVIGIYIINQLIEYQELRIQLNLRNIMENNLKGKAFTHLIKLKSNYYKDYGFIKVINDEIYNINNILKIAEKNFLGIFLEVFKTIGGAVGLFIINWKLSLLLIVVVPIKYIITNVCSKITRKLYSEDQELNKKYNLWLDDIASGIFDIKLWGLRAQKKKDFSSFVEKSHNLRSKIIKLNHIKTGIDIGCDEIIIDFLYVIGGLLIFNDTLTVGGLLSFIAFSTYLLHPISAVLGIKTTIASILPSLKAHHEFADLEEEYTTDMPEIKEVEKIEFKDVCFKFNEEYILKDISFIIKKGEKVAIVGPNGSGKSTIFNLLLKIYNPTEGRILVTNQDINRMDTENYRRLFAVVSQNVHLFNETILENVFLKNGREKDNKYFNKLLNEPLFSFINEFPDNVETDVGTNGDKLSGGEKQKIALLRAMISNANILLLDEATANYDFESEALCNELVMNCNKFDYKIIITHREKILKSVDKIILLEKGIIRKIGTYEEVYGGGKYEYSI